VAALLVARPLLLARALVLARPLLLPRPRADIAFLLVDSRPSLRLCCRELDWDERDALLRAAFLGRAPDREVLLRLCPARLSELAFADFVFRADERVFVPPLREPAAASLETSLLK
jgi:hypothetical protein